MDSLLILALDGGMLIIDWCLLITCAFGQTMATHGQNQAQLATPIGLISMEKNEI